MASGSSPSPNSDRVGEQLRLLECAEKGSLDNLMCPECSEPVVRVWFTKAQAGEFRTWFVCEECEFSFRVQNAQKPSFFDESRIHGDLDSYDAKLLGRKDWDDPGAATT